jgi:hypothetical protein
MAVYKTLAKLAQRFEMHPKQIKGKRQLNPIFT